MYKNNQNIEIRGSQMKKVILISLILVLGGQLKELIIMWAKQVKDFLVKQIPPPSRN